MKKLLLTGIVALFLVMPVSAEPIDPTDIQIIDGDTIHIHSKQPNIRLVGFNAPETRNATCQAEADLGARATRRLRDLVKLGNSTSATFTVPALKARKERSRAIMAAHAERFGRTDVTLEPSSSKRN
jgi:endonuclease YncB( thermonuclease family)